MSQPKPDFYGAVIEWIRARLESSTSPRPLIIGLSGPQGGGKTTLTRGLCELASQQGLRAISVSIDDFYLTRAAQIELARKHPENPYLQNRGYPGSHDIELGRLTLESLKHINESGTVLKLPSYDKSAHQGRGDRRPRSDWPVAEPPLDFVILEGWMLGFRPARLESSPAAQDAHFAVINRKLQAYQAWTNYLEAFIWLEAEDPSFVIEWRVEAEERMKAEGKSGLTREEIETYIRQFLIAYEVYLPDLLRQPPIHGPLLHIVLGKNRRPVRPF
jgi:D-glycerate 3-kinase